MNKVVVGFLVLALVGAVRAQDGGAEKKTAEQPTEQEAAQQQEDQKEALPSLDDLLGIEGDGGEGNADALDTNKAELERELTNEEVGEQFVQAIKQMEEAAKRLRSGRDAGVVTQRLQEEILVKLDILIEQSQQQNQQSSSSSSSSSSDSSQTPPQQGQQQQGQQRDQPSDPGSEAADGGGNPEYREGRNDLIESAGAAWGALPERVRDTLLEGLNDVFSSRYKEATEAYYRRLAEEGGPQ